MRWLRLITVVFLLAFTTGRNKVTALDGVPCSECEQQLNQCLVDMCDGQDDCQFCYPEYNACRSTCTTGTSPTPCTTHGTSHVDALEAGFAATSSTTDANGSCADFDYLEVIGRTFVDDVIVAASGEGTYGSGRHVRVDWSANVNASKVEQFGTHLWIQNGLYSLWATYDHRER